MGNYRLNDDELKKAAMGDLDDASTPPTPPKKKSKALWVIAIILVVLIFVGVFLNGNSDKNSNNYILVEDEEYYDTSEYDDDSIYTDTDDSYSEDFVYDAYNAIDRVIYDQKRQLGYVDIKDDYSETINGYTFTREVYEGEEIINVLNNENNRELSVHFYVNTDTYTSTGMVTVGVSGDNQGQFQLPENRDFEPVLCDYLSDSSQISDEDMNKMIDVATTIFTEQYPLAVHEVDYFGYDNDQSGDGGPSGYGEDCHYNQVRIVFSYSDSGYTQYGYVTFYELLYTEDGDIFNIDITQPDYFESNVSSLSELEQNDSSYWDTYCEI